jgi:outer membrane biosynthesis protein TonB
MKKVLISLALFMSACTTAPQKQESQTNLIRNPRTAKDFIQVQIQHNQKKIRDCYNPALAEEPSLKGKVVLEWEIGNGGVVENPQVVSSDLNNQRVESCVVEVIKNIRFRNAAKYNLAVVRYPFVFATRQN